MLTKVKEMLKTDPLFNVNGVFQNTVFDTIYSTYPELIKYGIIYERYKIVLKKIKTIQGYSQDTINCVSNFVNLVQRTIYTIIFKHFDLYNFKNIHSKIIIEHPIIKLLTDKTLLDKIPNNQLDGPRKSLFSNLNC